MCCYDIKTCCVKFKQDKTFDAQSEKFIFFFLFLKPTALVNIRLCLLGVQMKRQSSQCTEQSHKIDKRILQFGLNCLFTCSEFCSPPFIHYSVNKLFFSQFFCTKQTTIYPHNLTLTTSSKRLDQGLKRAVYLTPVNVTWFDKKRLQKIEGEVLNSSGTSRTLLAPRSSVWLPSLRSPQELL